MRRLLCRLAVVSALTSGAVFALGTSPATALSPVVADCNAHAALTHSYTVSQLRSALATMPADIREYTNCPDVIQRQLLAQLGKLPGNGGTGKGGGSFLPTPLIVVLGLLIAGGVGFGVMAIRQRRGR